MSDLKQIYIQKALTEYMRSVQNTMEIVLDKRANDTGNLKNSISSQVSKLTTAGGSAELKFKDYGRFIDMGVGKGHPIGAAAKNRDMVVLATNGKVLNAKPVRKPVKFYSKIAYGKLSGLMQDLLYGLTEEAIEKIKNELQHGNHNNN